jgi:hypothetical protein
MSVTPHQARAVTLVALTHISKIARNPDVKDLSSVLDQIDQHIVLARMVLDAQAKKPMPKKAKRGKKRKAEDEDPISSCTQSTTSKGSDATSPAPTQVPQRKQARVLVKR